MQNAKFHVKQKYFNFETKIALPAYFWAATLKIYYRIKIKNFEYVEFHTFIQNQETLTLVPKMPYLEIFGLESEMSIAIFEASTLEFIKKEVLTIIVYFSIGSVFPKNPRSPFAL